MNVKALTDKARADIESLRNEEGWLCASLGRYECFFGRDAAISSMQLLWYDISIAKATLIHLAKTRGKKVSAVNEEEPGRMVHEDRIVQDEEYFKLTDQGFVFPYYGSVDVTFLFVLLLERYVRLTDDTELIYELEPAVTEALQWIQSKIDHSGLVRVRTLNTHGEIGYRMVNKNWVDSPAALSYSDGSLPLDDPGNYPVAHADVQALLYALVAESDVLKGFVSDGASRILDDLKARQDELVSSFCALFAMPEDTYFAPAIDAKNRKFDIITSIPGWLLYAKMLPEAAAWNVCTRMFAPDIWTPYGVRVLSSRERQFSPSSYQQGAVWPHDNWIIWQGMQRYGFMHEAEKVRDAVLSGIEQLGRIPEFFNVSREGVLAVNAESMKVQAWACAATLSFCNAIAD